MTSGLSVLIGVASLYTMLAISPGPNFLVITQTAATGARHQAFFIALGVSSASIFWATLAALGLGYLIDDHPILQLFLQFFGGCYLLFFGYRLFGRTRLASSSSGVLGAVSPWRSYALGLFTNLANSKTFLFFISLFSGLFSANTEVYIRVLSVVIVAFISLCWNCLMVTAFSIQSLRSKYHRLKRSIDSVIGFAMVYFAFTLIFSSGFALLPLLQLELVRLN